MNDIIQKNISHEFQLMRTLARLYKQNWLLQRESLKHTRAFTSVQYHKATCLRSKYCIFIIKTLKFLTFEANESLVQHCLALLIQIEAYVSGSLNTLGYYHRVTCPFCCRYFKNPELVLLYTCLHWCALVFYIMRKYNPASKNKMQIFPFLLQVNMNCSLIWWILYFSACRLITIVWYILQWVFLLHDLWINSLSW